MCGRRAPRSEESALPAVKSQRWSLQKNSLPGIRNGFRAEARCEPSRLLSLTAGVGRALAAMASAQPAIFGATTGLGDKANIGDVLRNCRKHGLELGDEHHIRG